MIDDISDTSYSELLDALKKDLLLDPLTELLPTKGLALTSQVPRVNQGLVYDGTKWVPRSFLQLLSAQKLRLICGVVKLDGTIIYAGTGDWSVSRTGVGAYTLAYTATTTSSPVVLGTVIEDGSGASFRCTTFASSTTVSVSTITSAGVADDNSFGFAILG